jgi:hypothetical protein
LKILNTKRAGGVAEGVGPEFKPWYQKKGRKKSPKKLGSPHFQIQGEQDN